MTNCHPVHKDRICSLCNINQPISSFRKHPKGKDGLYSQCLKCEALKNKSRYLKSETKEIRKNWRNLNREKIRAYQKVNYWSNVDNNREKARKKGQKFRTSDSYKNWRDSNRDRLNSWYRQKRQTDPLYKLACNCRNRIYSILKNKYKKSAWKNIIGCTTEELHNYLESKFQPGMSWDNYGYGTDKWNIDHIMPLSSAKNKKEIIDLCNFKNLQPMWQVENFKKSDKIL